MPPDAILFIAYLLNWRPLCIGRSRPVYSDRNEVDILLHTALRFPADIRSGLPPACAARRSESDSSCDDSAALDVTTRSGYVSRPGCPSEQQDKAVKTRVHFRAAQFILVRCNSAESGIQFLSAASARFHWLSRSQAITASRLICAAPSAALPQPAGARSGVALAALVKALGSRWEAGQEPDTSVWFAVERPSPTALHVVVDHTLAGLVAKLDAEGTSS
jgi:hypothetical protein